MYIILSNQIGMKNSCVNLCLMFHVTLLICVIPLSHPLKEDRNYTHCEDCENNLILRNRKGAESSLVLVQADANCCNLATWLRTNGKTERK